MAQARRSLLELSQGAEDHQEEKQRRQGELAAVLAVLQVRVAAALLIWSAPERMSASSVLYCTVMEGIARA